MTICECRVGAVKVGMKVKVRKRKEIWEYIGVNKENGKVILCLPGSLRVCMAVNGAEIDWEPGKEK